jgi:hypothetical protein
MLIILKPEHTESSKEHLLDYLKKNEYRISVLTHM